MTTYTANHLVLALNLFCTTGTWAGETAAMTWKFAVNGGSGGGRPGLNDGKINLNTFDVHTNTASRALSISSTAGTVQTSWLGDSPPDTEQVTDNDIDFFLTKAGNFFAAMTTWIRSDYAVSSIKLYATGADGKSPSGPNTWTPTAPWAATSTGLTIPEIACVISHYSAERSRRGRGRLFLGPLGGSFFLSSGLFATSLTGAAGNAEKALQDSVRTRGAPGSSATYVGITWNAKGGKTPSDGTTGSVINRIRVGDEPDHMESRTRSRPEVFTNWDVV